MKKFSVLATAYHDKQLGEIDIKSFRSKTAYRYRQDIFPQPEPFKVQVVAVVPEIVETGDAVYTHRLKLTVFLPEDTSDTAIARYKSAIENKTRLFDVRKSADNGKSASRKPEPVKEPVAEPEPVSEPVAETPAEPAPEVPAEVGEPAAEAASAKPKKASKKKSKK